MSSPFIKNLFGRVAVPKGAEKALPIGEDFLVGSAKTGRIATAAAVLAGYPGNT